MADRTFEVNITTAVQAPYAIKKAGYAGEHNATAIQINLPADYIGGFTYSLDLMTGSGEAYPYPLVLTDGDDFLYFELSKPLTDKGALDFQLKITETATGMVVKTRVINLQIIGRDVSAYAELAENYLPPVDINGSASGLVIEVAKNSAARHEHANILSIGKLTEDDDGKPLYDGEPIGSSEVIEYVDDIAEAYNNYPFRYLNRSEMFDFSATLYPSMVSLKTGTLPKLSEMNEELEEENKIHSIILLLAEIVTIGEGDGVEIGHSIQITVSDGTTGFDPFEIGQDYIVISSNGFDNETLALYLYLFDDIIDNTDPENPVVEFTGGSLYSVDVETLELTILPTVNWPTFVGYKILDGSWFEFTPDLPNLDLMGNWFNGETISELYVWNGTEYVEVSGADLYAITVNEVAPINGNITLDTSNIVPTGDRQYVTVADLFLLYALRGNNDRIDFPNASFILSGAGNEITSANSVIAAGVGNSVSGGYSATIGGAGNSVSAICSAIIGGDGLIASADYSAIVGRNGETPADSRFAVANGTDENNKKIVFYVGGDGVSHFDEMPVVPADRVITEDNQLVDKKYVDENAGSAVPYTGATEDVNISPYTLQANNIVLPATTADSGQIKIGGHSFIHNYGYENLFVGYDSGNFYTTGSQNSAVGYRSIYSNTTGNSNSAMGYFSLYSNTTGGQNSAMGYYSLNSNTVGSRNAAMGYASLYLNTTGNYNAAIGHSSLYSLKSGNSNIAIGFESGKTCTSIDNSIFIGSSTKPLNSSGDINEIVIGHNATGNGSNTVTLGHTDIVSTVLRGDVKSGTKLTDSTGTDAAKTITMEKTDSSTKIATTKFVKNVLEDYATKEYVDENSGSVPIVAYTNALYIGKSHTLTTGDNTTFTLPTVSNPAVLNQFRIEIKATSAISVTWTGGNLRAGGVAYVYGVGAHVVIGTWSTIQEKWLLDAQIYGGV